MIVVVDTSALILLINPGANPPIHPITRKPVEKARERIEHFLASLTVHDVLVIPTPVLAEALVRAGPGAPELLAAMSGQARFKIQPFDIRAAYETAAMTQEAIAKDSKRHATGEPWQKVKFDRQIIAIARVASASLILADDKSLVSFAREIGCHAKSTWELDEPPAPPVTLITMMESTPTSEE